MRTICVINHKGGVGKTTTAVNLAAGLTRNNKKILLIDLDPQGNVDISLQVNSKSSLYDAMMGRASIQECIVNLATNFDVITSTESLVKAEYHLSRNDNARLLLRDMFRSIRGYDYIIIDCPPSLGLITQNALTFCSEAFVPASTDFLGMDALKKMKAVIAKINETYQHGIRLTKIIPTMYDRRNRICKETFAEMHTAFGPLVSDPIGYNSKLKEAPKHGKSIFSYAKSSSGAQDYARLVNSVLAMETSLIKPEAVVSSVVS